MEWIVAYTIEYDNRLKTVIKFEGNVILTGLSHQQASVVCGTLNGAYNLGRMRENLDKEK